MQINKVQSVEYFAISIHSDNYYKICIVVVLFHKGFSFNFFERGNI
jgi:hypothetical protein